MNIEMPTTNNIIHLVEDRDRLLEIIKEGFVPNYHKEDLSSSDMQADKLVIGIPMTSFSDLPLKELDFMMREYGRFGIVMSKLWALQSQNLSPVHYISDMEYLKSVIHGIKSDNIPLDCIRYTKKFFSEWNGKPYNNYSEREWRHAVSENDVRWFESEESYNAWRYKSKKRPKAGKDLRKYALGFDIKDIAGLIVPTEKDKKLLMQALRSIKQFSGANRQLSVTELAYLEYLIITDI